MATFNLKQYLTKQANYEGIQGYFVAQTRSWQNCVRAKLNKGASAQDAWQGCVDDYQKAPNNMDWVSKNTHEDELKKSAQYGAQFQMGSYWHKIKKHQKNGLTVAQAVMEALKECEQEAIPLHESAGKTNLEKQSQRLNVYQRCICADENYHDQFGCGALITDVGLDSKESFCIECRDGHRNMPRRAQTNSEIKTAGHAGKLLGLPGVVDVPSTKGGVTTVVVDEKMEQGFLANLASRGYEQVGNQPFRSPNGVVFQVRETPIAQRPALNQIACKECGCGHPGEEHGGKCTCPASCDCKKKGGSCFET